MPGEPQPMHYDGLSIIYGGVSAGTVSISLVGYTCMKCGCWVPSGVAHACGTMFGYRCYGCGQWVFGTSHVCVPVATCRHCYCIDVSPSGERTRPHAKCCKCQDIRPGKAVEG